MPSENSMTALIALVTLMILVMFVCWVYLWNTWRTLRWIRLDPDSVDAACMRNALRRFKHALWLIAFFWVFQVGCLGIALVVSQG